MNAIWIQTQQKNLYLCTEISLSILKGKRKNKTRYCIGNQNNILLGEYSSQHEAENVLKLIKVQIKANNIFYEMPEHCED